MCALARRHQDTICPLCLTVSQYPVLDRDGGADHQDDGADHQDGGPNHQNHRTCQAQ